MDKILSFFKKALCVVVAFVLLCSLCSCVPDLHRTKVIWRDEQVGQAAAIALGKRPNAPVFFEELDNITQLVLTSSSPVDLTDLSGLDSLICVDLRDAEVTDYSPLLSCNNLTELYVGKIEYEPYINDLERLQEKIPITDIDVDKNYYSLIPVIFYDPIIEDAVRCTIEKPVGSLSLADTRLITIFEIDSVNYSDNQLSSPEDLTQLIHLREITLKNFNISDTGFFKDLGTLLYVNLDNNSVSDFTFLEFLPQIRVLSLKHNNITSETDFSPLLNCTKLTGLSLSENPISSAACNISDLSNLETLNLSECNISDISFISNLNNLNVLLLSDNNISDLKPLETLSELRILVLNSNKIKNIDYLSGLKNLEQLYLGNNNISNISCIESMHALQDLTLTLNNIYDISPLSQISTLKSLYIANNPIIDYSPILDFNIEDSDIDFMKAQTACLEGQKIADSTEGLDPFGKVKYIHDTIASMTQYDYEAVQTMDLGFQNQSAWSALVRGKCVCAGYAEAFTMIARQCNLEAYTVQGTGEGQEHAWNLVYIDGTAYYIDVTWDDSDTGNQVYTNYLLISEEKISKDHDWNKDYYIYE